MRPELIQAVQLLREDDPASTEKALALLQNTVYSFSMKVCGHPEDAEDTMQEVLFRSLGHLKKISEPRALAVWLYTVTRNRCWRMRRKSVYAPAHTYSLDELMPDERELRELLTDPADGPERVLASAEQNQMVQQAILMIPHALRIVLVLHDMEELSTEETAQVLGLQTGTVRVRLHRARLALRRELGRLRMEERQADGDGNRDAGEKRRGGAEICRRSTECRKIFANLSEYLDGRVEPRTCEELRNHIEACPSCVAFLRDLRDAIDRCRAMQPECDPAVAARLRAALTREYLRLLGMRAELAGKPSA
jgi:RNA polymerase sigma-70 factor (ECF subfamily)